MRVSAKKNSVFKKDGLPPLYPLYQRFVNFHNVCALLQLKTCSLKAILLLWIKTCQIIFFNGKVGL